MNKLYGFVIIFVIGLCFSTFSKSAFFRITGEEDSVITHFDPSTGEMIWSNSVAGVTNQIQKTSTLTGLSNWVDYVQVISVSNTTSAKIIDLNQPEGMVLIPSGINSGTDPDARDYSLTVDVFYMDAVHVTKEQWDTVHGWAVTNGYSFDNAGLGKAPNHPVHSVSWYDMLKWCNARSQMDGRDPCYLTNSIPYKNGQLVPECAFEMNGYRLPTNEEWEYAARGGLSGKRFPWGDDITHSNANYRSTTNYVYDVSSTLGYHPDFDEDGYPYTSPVGSFPPNGYGVFDATGNIYDRTWAPISGKNFRGGTWTGTAYNLRTWFGGRTADLTSIDNRYGFRCVSSSKD